MAKTCPNCHAELEDDAHFCGSCGRQLAAAESEEPTGYRSGASVRSGLSRREGKPFSIRLARPAAFCAGRRSPLEVVFRSSVDVFSSVSFHLLHADREVAAQTLRVRPGTSEHRVRLEVLPRDAGGAALELRVALRTDGVSEPEIHVARLIADVDEASGRNSIVNVTPQISSDRAGHNEIGTLNLNIAEGAFGTRTVDASRYEMLLPAEDMPTDLLSSPARLTLRAESGETIQLLSDDEITFGRNRDNAVVSRIFGAGGHLDRAANEGNISRFHFKVVRRRDGAHVVDIGSTNGTRLNGDGIVAPEGVRIDTASESLLAVGSEGRALEYEIHPHANGWNGLAGLVLKRRDSAPEQVVVVWGGRVPFADGAFLREGMRWTFATAAGASVGLGLMSGVEIGGRRMRVLPFHHPFV